MTVTVPASALTPVSELTGTTFDEREDTEISFGEVELDAMGNSRSPKGAHFRG